MTDKTIGACRDAYNAARKPVEIEAWALTYGLWLLDLAEDGARLRADGDLPDTAAEGEQQDKCYHCGGIDLECVCSKPDEGEILLPKPDMDGDYQFPDGTWVWKYIETGLWSSPDLQDFYDTPHAAARALAALGKGPGATRNQGRVM